MVWCRGGRARPGPTLPLTPRVALGTSSLRPSGRVFIDGTRCAGCCCLGAGRPLFLHRGLHSRGHQHPASQAVLAAGFLIPTVSPSHLLVIAALPCPRLFMDHGRGLLKD